MSEPINFTDFVMSRYARKNSVRGKLIGRLKEGILRGDDPYPQVLELSSNTSASMDERNAANEVLGDWVEEQKKIAGGVSKVVKYVGNPGAKAPATESEGPPKLRVSIEIDWEALYRWMTSH